MKHYFEFFAVLCAMYGVTDMAATAVSAPTVMSKYGEIQSVNKYSSNPFWTPNSPYNQRIPTPIYVTGADLNTDNCNRVVATLVDAYCQENNYCANKKISDARPYLMVQLSQLPGHNFATACGGYVDAAFSKYKQDHPTGVNVSSMMVQTAGANKSTNVQFENPWKQTKTEYEQGVVDRTAELDRLQQQTATSPSIVATAFPTTISDLSFSERVANDTAGFEPYKDKSAYVIPDFESDAEFYARLKEKNPAEYNKLFHGDADTTDQGDAASNKTKKCPDPEHMDANCKECKDIDLHKTKFDKTTNKCVCENGGDINQGCITEDLTNVPSCLTNLATNAAFQTEITKKLKNTTDFNKWIKANKSDLYSIIAEKVVDNCLKSTGNDIAEFNEYLDRSDTLPITIAPKGKESTILKVNAIELFDYVSYWTAPIVIDSNAAPYSIGAIINKTDINLPKIAQDCTGKSYLKRVIIWEHQRKDTVLSKACQSTYPSADGDRYMLGSVHFTGLIHAHTLSTINRKGIAIKNYAESRKKIKLFAKTLQTADSCHGANMVVYLISELTPEWDNPQTAKIMSEPFIIR